jgi:pseudaminic acid cytidylyltransferase
MTSRIAIITARGGSKRIPRKNIKNFLGKPIIAYSIDSAQKAECFDEIMVSTDDEEIAEVAQKYGASVPFFRSAKTSEDFSSTADVLVEVLLEYKGRNINFEQACCLYPAAPFITEKLLLQGLRKMEETEASALIPVAAFPSSIWRALAIENDKLKRLWPENEMKSSQELSSTYFDVGQFYWLQVETFLKNKKLLSENTTTLVMSWNEIQDIDTQDDWNEAEYKYQRMRNRQLYA